MLNLHKPLFITHYSFVLSCKQLFNCISKTSQPRWEQHHGISYHPYILGHFANYACICCMHRRVVDGSGVGSAGCVVHVDVHGE